MVINNNICKKSNYLNFEKKMYFSCNNSFFIDFFFILKEQWFFLTILLFEQIFREIKIRHAKLNSNDLNQVR